MQFMSRYLQERVFVRFMNFNAERFHLVSKQVYKRPVVWGHVTTTNQADVSL